MFLMLTLHILRALLYCGQRRVWSILYFCSIFGVYIICSRCHGWKYCIVMYDYECEVRKGEGEIRYQPQPSLFEKHKGRNSNAFTTNAMQRNFLCNCDQGSAPSFLIPVPKEKLKIPNLLWIKPGVAVCEAVINNIPRYLFL